MIWRSTTKVGFGVQGDRVVALYCPKGNVKGRFACNVCKAGAGCDANKCPLPDSVCSSKDGEGNAEISLTADKKSIRIIATVKKGQSYAIALGKESLVDSDLIVFNAKDTAAASTATDSRATSTGAAPAPESPSAIAAATKTDEGQYIRFDTTRTLAPGSGHFAITKGTTHKMGWGQYIAGNLASVTNTGTCSLKLPGTKEKTPTTPAPGTSSCPAAKRDSTTDAKRQQDCSPSFSKKCYDVDAGQYKNANCPAGSSCGQWISTIGTERFYENGCILQQYCNTKGDYNQDRNVNFKCPGKDANGSAPPTTPTTPTTPTGPTNPGTVTPPA
jgi:hypothetical protein